MVNDKPTILSPVPKPTKDTPTCPHCGRPMVENPTNKHVCQISSQGLPLRFKKDDKIDTRAINRHHKFRLGDEPDAPHPDSGWVTLKFEATESTPTPPDQKTGLGGGPESGMLCWKCKFDSIRIVAKKPPSEILEDAYTIDKDRTKIKDTDDVYLLACPRCQATMQIRGDVLNRVRYRRTGRV